MRAPTCEPTATISGPSLVTRPSVWLMPRPLAATVNWLPARVAGGKPSEDGGGAGPELPLLASAITTTAMPEMIMATIGTTTRTARPRKCKADRNSLNQLRLTGSGRNERSSRAHSRRARPWGRGPGQRGPAEVAPAAGGPQPGRPRSRGQGRDRAGLSGRRGRRR